MAEVKTKLRKPKKQIAGKSTMNLAFHESSVNLKMLVPMAAMMVLVALVFLKFGFLDPLDKKTAALNDLSERQLRLQMVNAQLVGYDELAAEYGRYSYGWMTEQESALVDRMDIMSIVERVLSPAGTIEDVAVKDNVLSVTISGLSLQQTSQLVKKLEDEKLITSVSVYSATAEDPTLAAKVAMTIILEKEAQENG